MLEFLSDVWRFFVVCSYYRWESNWNNVVSKSYFLRSNEASCLPINSCSDEQALLLLAGGGRGPADSTGLLCECSGGFSFWWWDQFLSDHKFDRTLLATTTPSQIVKSFLSEFWKQGVVQNLTHRQMPNPKNKVTEPDELVRSLSSFSYAIASEFGIMRICMGKLSCMQEVLLFEVVVGFSVILSLFLLCIWEKFSVLTCLCHLFQLSSVPVYLIS